MKTGDLRADRLAEALRANLRKRKAQARAAGDDQPPTSTEPRDTAEPAAS